MAFADKVAERYRRRRVTRPERRLIDSLSSADLRGATSMRNMMLLLESLR